MNENEYRDSVYAEAKQVQTPEQLTEFIAKRYGEELDYGTIVYACAATMKAAFRVMDSHPQYGGITGFQAGCLMWEMVREFGMFSDGPLKIIDYDNLRFPQYDVKFGHTLSKESAEDLQKRAQDFLRDNHHSSPDVEMRNIQIARGEFPDFITLEDR